VDSLALFKITNEEDAVLISKIEARTVPADFALGIFWSGEECAGMPPHH
jgi:hypothetical protein